MKLAGGRVIVDARSLEQSIDQWLTLSHARLRKPRGNRGGACVIRVVLDPIAGSRQRQGPGGVAGGEVDLRSMITRRLVRRGEFASSLPVTG
jgi:hypothetical protein